MILNNIAIRIIDMFQEGELIEEFTQKGSPKLIYNGSDDKYQPIMASEFSFNMIVTDLSDGKFYHLYTGNEKRYKVTVHDQDDRLLWEGYLLPDFYSEPYDNGVFFVELTATDGLGLLKGHYLPDNFYKKETSVMKLITECLKLCKLDKVIHFSPAFMSAATDYLWHEITVNGLSYLEGEIIVEKYDDEVIEILPERKTAYEILELLLKNLGSTLYCWGNVWYIEGINRKHESSQYYHLYDLNCNFLGYNIDNKEIASDLKFFKTPTVSIVSPWKQITISFDLDENENIISESDIKWDSVNSVWVAQAGMFLPPSDSFNYPPENKWNVNGLIVRTLGNIVPHGMTEEEMYNNGRYIGVYYPSPDSILGEKEENFWNNFLSIRKKKFVKGSDKYLKRFFKWAIEIDAPKSNFIGIEAFEEKLKQGKFDKVFRMSLVYNNEVLKSTIYNAEGDKKVNLKLDFWSYPIPTTPGITHYNRAGVRGSFKVEFLNDVWPGEVDLRFYSPVCLDFENPEFYRYYIKSLELTYTPEKEWKDLYIRDIDYTTKYELDLFHGDSISDLTIKNFRFQRFYETGPVEREITIYFSTLGSRGGVVNRFIFVIDNDSYEFLKNNDFEEYLYVLFDGNIIHISEIYPNGFNFTFTFEGGFIRLNLFTEGIADTSYIAQYHLWQGFIIQMPSSFIPVEENRLWREDWKRFSVSENLRYGDVMANIYHSVYPASLVKIEGDLEGIYNPRELLKFNWREEKIFIPTRMTLNFSESKTSVLLLESAYDNELFVKGKI